MWSNGKVQTPSLYVQLLGKVMAYGKSLLPYFHLVLLFSAPSLQIVLAFLFLLSISSIRLLPTLPVFLWSASHHILANALFPI